MLCYDLSILSKVIIFVEFKRFETGGRTLPSLVSSFQADWLVIMGYGHMFCVKRG